jgi:hypothetical protein
VALSTQEPRPDSSSRLLPVSSQEKTSSVMPLLNRSTPYLIAASVSSDASVTFMPSGVCSVPPNEYMTERQLWLPSLQLASGRPQGWPFSFSLADRSSRVM